MDFLKKTVAEFSRDRCTTLAAALAYYTLFALPPLLYLLLTILTVSLSMAYESDTAESQAESLIQQNVAQLIGNDAAANEIGQILQNNQQASGKWWKSLISIIGILFGATGVVVALQDSLNVVWSVQPDPDTSTIKDFAMKRVMSLAMILGLGFLMLASMVVSTILSAAGDQVGQWLGISATISELINFGVLFVVTTVIFGAIFKFMPDVQIAFRDVWVGALVTAVLFAVGRIGLEAYFSYSNPGAQLGGAAATLAAILVWVYYTAMIVLYGAEFTQVYAQRFGRGAEPEPGAVRVVQDFRRTQVPATS